MKKIFIAILTVGGVYFLLMQANKNKQANDNTMPGGCGCCGECDDCKGDDELNHDPLEPKNLTTDEVKQVVASNQALDGFELGKIIQAQYDNANCGGCLMDRKILNQYDAGQDVNSGFVVKE